MEAKSLFTELLIVTYLLAVAVRSVCAWAEVLWVFEVRCEGMKTRTVLRYCQFGFKKIRSCSFRNIQKSAKIQDLEYSCT